MAIITSGPDQALMDAAVAVPIYLVLLDFRSGQLRLTNWPLTVTAMSYDWVGLGALGEIGEMKESEDGTEEKLPLYLSPVNPALISLALNDPSEYLGRDVLIYHAMLDKDTFLLASTPALRYAGLMDQIGIEMNDSEGKIKLDCRTGSYAARNNPITYRINNTQHQERYPGEKGCEYIQSLIETPPVWLSKTFQATLIG